MHIDYTVQIWKEDSQFIGLEKVFLAAGFEFARQEGRYFAPKF